MNPASGGLNVPFSWPWPRWIAHRGAGHMAPENTLAALRTGFELGVRAVEFDVMLSADEVPIAIHDTELGRTVAGRGSVADLRAEQLLALDAGQWFAPQYAGERVPTYEAMFRYCRAHGIWMNVEIKPVPGHEARTGAVVAATTRRLLAVTGGLSLNTLNRLDSRSRVASVMGLPLFSSFSSVALDAARAAAPEIPRACLFDILPSDWRAQLEALGCIGFDCEHTQLNRDNVRAIKQAGVGLLCYTVNDPVRAAQLFDWGVDAVCTDRLDIKND